MIVKNESIEIKNASELDILREVGKIASNILKNIKKNIRPGIATEELDRIARKEFEYFGVEPAFLGYRGFPASICVSVNEELVHGIPSKTKTIKYGDIVKIDLGIRYKGFYGDIAETVPVGKVSKEILDLLKVTYRSFDEVAKSARAENRIGDLSNSIQEYVESKGYSVIRDYVGHGIGRILHEKPEVPNFGSPGLGPRLASGMVLAVEPMVAMGKWEVELLSDNWTVVTSDRKLCAHFEHMIVITENKPEFLTEIDTSELN